MATLVLSTVGTLLGGPVGGAIGSLVGQSIDQQIFGPGRREGPRLGDLSVQTSSYGTAIPKIFGTMRVAGSIVWSTDLEESSETQAAKGQPDAVTYSYTVSFAVALSSRPIIGVRRIWADGKLIRTADGEFTVATGFRICDGSESQAVDPLIASLEGPDSTPAYRGVALAIFEHLDLSEFGNRIPFLTFEVEADASAVSLGQILAEASGGSIACSSSVLVPGYAAHGATIESAIAPLVEIFGVPLLDYGSAVVSPKAEIVAPGEDEMGCTAEPEAQPRSELLQIPARSTPTVLAISYYDPDRDYQIGVARASVGTTTLGSETLELPAVLLAGAAKGLAETSLGRRWAQRDTLRLRLPPAYIGLGPGTLMAPGDSSQTWRVEQVTLESMAVIAELRPSYSTAVPLPADPGRVLPSLDAVPVPTELSLFELPDDGSGRDDSPIVAVAASNRSAIWRPVPLDVEVGGAISHMSTSGRAVMGSVATALGSGQSAVLDLLNSVEIELVDPDQWLESRDDSALADGANLALLGNELIQFGTAVPLTTGRFRLSRLLRGRRGTEWAMELHEANETFVMLDPTRLRLLEVSRSQVGAHVSVTARGLADSGFEPVQISVSGEAMRPPSPAHLRAAIDLDGSLRCSWVRRSRLGWPWLDGVDAPLGCSTELYRVTLRSETRSLISETSASAAQFSAGEMAGLGTGTIGLSVVQVGDFAVSHPASLTISID